MATPSIPNEFTLSTTCFGDRLGKIEDQIFTAVAMGFRSIELGLSETPVTMDGLCDARSETSTKLVSMIAGCRDSHNGEMIVWKLASTDDTERERALNSLRRHLRLADTWGCTRFVVRGTSVDDPALKARAEELEGRMAVEGLGEEGAEGALATEIRGLAEEVQTKGQTQVEHLCRGLHALRKEFPSVHLCVEAGERLDDLMGIEAMGWVQADLPDICYWHDAGVIHQRERQGLPGQGEWLDRFANRMGGMHLQDADGDMCELPVGLGEIDFKLIAEYAPKEALRVVEIGSRHGRAEILASVQALINFGL
jgi:sugar phosphate isomerase/epimerase